MSRRCQGVARVQISEVNEINKMSGQNDADMENIYIAYLLIKNGGDSIMSGAVTRERVLENLREILTRRGDYAFSETLKP